MKRGFLSLQEREALIEQHRQERNRKRADRIKVVLWTDDGLTQEQIAKLLFIHTVTVRQHLDDYQEEDRLNLNCKGSQPILTEAESQALSEQLEEKTYTKVIHIQAYILKTFKKKMGLTTIRTWLAKNEFTYKKPVLRPKNADQKQQEEFIEKYHQLMNEAAANGDPVLFADAVHPTQQIQAVYGWDQAWQRQNHRDDRRQETD